VMDSIGEVADRGMLGEDAINRLTKARSSVAHLAEAHADTDSLSLDEKMLTDMSKMLVEVFNCMLAFHSETLELMKEALKDLGPPPFHVHLVDFAYALTALLAEFRGAIIGVNPGASDHEEEEEFTIPDEQEPIKIANSMLLRESEVKLEESEDEEKMGTMLNEAVEKMEGSQHPAVKEEDMKQEVINEETGEILLVRSVRKGGEAHMVMVENDHDPGDWLERGGGNSPAVPTEFKTSRRIRSLTIERPQHSTPAERSWLQQEMQWMRNRNRNLFGYVARPKPTVSKSFDRREEANSHPPGDGLSTSANSDELPGTINLPIDSPKHVEAKNNKNSFEEEQAPPMETSAEKPKGRPSALQKRKDAWAEFNNRVVNNQKSTKEEQNREKKLKPTPILREEDFVEKKKTKMSGRKKKGPTSVPVFKNRLEVVNCPYCGRKSMTDRSMAEHMREEHPVEYERISSGTRNEEKNKDEKEKV
ncbi:hypothetical protein PFISCL1PPCAC_4425, partial [Pristionchus fissidentatus]